MERANGDERGGEQAAGDEHPLAPLGVEARVLGGERLERHRDVVGGRRRACSVGAGCFVNYETDSDFDARMQSGLSTVYQTKT